MNKQVVSLALFVFTKNLYDFFCHFKVCIFKSHVPSRRNVKNESKVNMNKMTFFVNKNVSIMSIFCLEDVRNDWIACLRRYEVLSRFTKCFWVFRTKVFHKVSIKVHFISFSQLISRWAIWNNLYDASNVLFSPSSIRNAFIGHEEKIKIVLIEDVFKQFDNLYC